MSTPVKPNAQKIKNQGVGRGGGKRGGPGPGGRGKSHDPSKPRFPQNSSRGNDGDMNSDGTQHEHSTNDNFTDSRGPVDRTHSAPPRGGDQKQRLYVPVKYTAPPTTFPQQASSLPPNFAPGPHQNMNHTNQPHPLPPNHGGHPNQPHPHPPNHGGHPNMPQPHPNMNMIPTHNGRPPMPGYKQKNPNMGPPNMPPPSMMPMPATMAPNMGPPINPNMPPPNMGMQPTMPVMIPNNMIPHRMGKDGIPYPIRGGYPMIPAGYPYDMVGYAPYGPPHRGYPMPGPPQMVPMVRPYPPNPMHPPEHMVMAPHGPMPAMVHAPVPVPQPHPPAEQPKRSHALDIINPHTKEKIKAPDHPNPARSLSPPRYQEVNKQSRLGQHHTAGGEPEGAHPKSAPHKYTLQELEIPTYKPKQSGQAATTNLTPSAATGTPRKATSPNGSRAGVPLKINPSDLTIPTYQELRAKSPERIPPPVIPDPVPRLPRKTSAMRINASDLQIPSYRPKTSSTPDRKAQEDAKAAQEAKEKAEKEEKEKLEAKEKAEREEKEAREAKEKAEREEVERIAREKEEKERIEREEREAREAKEKAEREAERIAREKAEEEERAAAAAAAEKLEQEEREAKEKAAREEAERAAREKAEQEEREAKEKADREEAERAAREKAEEEERAAAAAAVAEQEAKEKAERIEKEKVPVPQKPKITKKKKRIKEIDAKGGGIAAATRDAYAEQKKVVEPEPQVIAEPEVVPEPPAPEPESSEDDDWETKDQDEILNKAVKAVDIKPVKWVPHLNGEKVYPRGFLLQFEKMFTEKPEGWAASFANIVIESEESKRKISGTGKKDAWRSNTPRSTSSKENFGAGRGKGHPNDRDLSPAHPRGRKQKVQHPKIEMPENPNRWQRPKKDTDESETFRRSIRQLLNKITPENFEKLFAELSVPFLAITSYNYLEIVVDLIFEKALNETNYCEMYATLCFSLVEIPDAPCFQSGPEEKLDKNFRRAIITSCQRAFEVKQKPRAPLAVEGQDLTPEEKMDLEARAKKLRDQNIGNIKFIGALFKKQVLSEVVMHRCLTALVAAAALEENQQCNEDIEDFCHLMNVVGILLDTEKAEGAMNYYFKTLEELIASGRVIPRIKFTFQNLQELRANKWVPKKKSEPLKAPKSDKSDKKRTNRY